MIPVIDKAAYSQLLVKFQPKVIETEEEYNSSDQVLLELMARGDRTPEETAVLKLITSLVKDYERKLEKLEPPELVSPHEMLLHLMEENNLRQADLAGRLGSSGVVSEIVNGKRSISKSQAKTLGEIFQVSPGLFI
ncbi:MAG: helix-turn-helix domain-containing protein [Symploca sp. SIO1C4]|uniref:Helix-turn-helix domain-containing protein n=1 Tax=Symploca sp. SIO1C4 TaxID=2607765 RepID=A0A6B3NDR9_9CYAN|nr:helix-turn-helix domain-containing protein [Symploca sp. SIO1C4]